MSCDTCTDSRGIGERLAKIETILDRMDHELFGNGQPGILAKHEQRIDSIEKFKWQIMGAAALLGALAGVLGGHVK